MRNCLASTQESKHSIKDIDLSEIIGILSFELRLSPVLLQYSITSFFATELLILDMANPINYLDNQDAKYLPSRR